MLAILNYPDSYDEYDLLRQLGDGSEYAFTRLFDQYRGTIYGVALKFLKSPVLAESLKSLRIKPTLKLYTSAN